MPKTNTKTYKDRPTGEDSDRYVGHEKWSLMRWAWEFLRRNREFYAACKEIQDKELGLAEKLEVAGTFGLVQFKSASEQYGVAEKRPKFRVAVPRTYTRLHESDEIRVPRNIDVGELVARIDLRPALFDVGLLELQIDGLRKRAKAKLSELANARKLEAPKARRNKEGVKATNLDLLRLLDLRFAKRSPKQIVSLLFPSALEPKKSGNSYDQFFEGVKSRAEAMTKYGYLTLVREGQKSAVASAAKRRKTAALGSKKRNAGVSRPLRPAAARV